MKLIYSICFLLSLIVLNSCAGFKIEDCDCSRRSVAPEQELFPLHVGDYWSYASKFHGNSHSYTMTVVDTFSVWFNNESGRVSTTAYELEMKNDKGIQDPLYFIKCNNRTLEVKIKKSEVVAINNQYLDTLKKGETWNMPATNNFENTWKCISEDSVVFKYHLAIVKGFCTQPFAKAPYIDGQDLSYSLYYYMKGVGLVATKHYDKEGKLFSMFVLKEAQVHEIMSFFDDNIK